MKLKTLTILFSSTDEFLQQAREEIYTEIDENNKNIYFDNMETFRRILGPNRIDILMAIARQKPESIYQLSSFLDREHHHVTKDCRFLEGMGFITLDTMGGSKKQLVPSLVFDFDLIIVKDKMEKIFSISERSNNLILNAL